MHFELCLSTEAAAALPRLPLVARSRTENTPAQTLHAAGDHHAAEPARPDAGDGAEIRDAQAAGTVPAEPGAASRRSGRARSVRRRIVWHDSPDRRLAGAGLALAEERGVWRVERLVPAADGWPPGAPVPILGEDADPAQLTCEDGSPLPGPLAPIAAFEGQVTEHVLTTEDGPVVLHRLRGLLRAVAAERAVARVTLAGPDAAVRHAARTLVDTLNAEVPRATLAAEALSVATGHAPPPRRLGAPDMPGGLSVAAAFGHVVGHLTDVILHHAPVAADPRSMPESVHQARVAVRRLRSAIAVFRPAIGCDAVTEADRHLRTLARALGPARDWDVFMTETAPAIAGVLPDDERLQRLLAAGARRRTACHAALTEHLESAAFRRCAVDLAWLAGAQSWHDTIPEERLAERDRPLTDFAAVVLQKRLKKLRSAGKLIEELGVPALHSVRLRAKRMRYAAEILAPLFPAKPARRFIARLAVLQARLGVLNDGAVAGNLMAELGGATGRHAYAAGLVTGFATARQATIRPRILRSWEKFLRQPSFWT